MDALELLQWLLFGSAALVWMTFCGTNLLLLFSRRRPTLLPLIGATAGVLAALSLPESMVLSNRIMLAGLLFAIDPYWIAVPLMDARTWLQRR